jgi:hypothetical protein
MGAHESRAVAGVFVRAVFGFEKDGCGWRWALDDSDLTGFGHPFRVDGVNRRVHLALDQACHPPDATALPFTAT